MTQRQVHSATAIGARVPGLPITHSLDGEGTLTNGVDFTDADGRAEILFLAPTNAPGTSVISAVLVFDNQNYTNTATVTARCWCAARARMPGSPNTPSGC